MHAVAQPVVVQACNSARLLAGLWLVWARAGFWCGLVGLGSSWCGLGLGSGWCGRVG